MTFFRWFLVFTFGVGVVVGGIVGLRTAPARTSPPSNDPEIERQAKATLALIDIDRPVENRANFE